MSFSCHHFPANSGSFCWMWSRGRIGRYQIVIVKIRLWRCDTGTTIKPDRKEKREKTKRKQLTTTAATGSFEIAATSKSSTVKLLSAFWTFRCYYSCQIRQIVVALLYWLRFPGQSNQRRIGSSHFISTGYYTFKGILILNEAVMPSSFRMVKSPDVGKGCRENGQF